ncbi:MAG TPA: hypothetical protein VF669_16900 [Tepidisphaeraceae bacterium]|jgi:hypothetical protein
MTPAPISKVQHAKLGLLVLATVLLAVFLLTRESYGTLYFSVGVDRAPPWPLLAVLLVIYLPFLLAQIARDRLALPLTLTVPLLMLSMFLAQLASSSLHYGYFDQFNDIQLTVENPDATSYMQDALAIHQQDLSLRQLLSTYPQRMAHFQLHSREKPPGPILYYLLLINIFGPVHRASILGGILVGALSTLTLPAVCWLVRALTHSRAAAFYAASFLALTPSVIVLLPHMDLTYGIFTGTFLAAWVMSLRTARWSWSIACGIALAAMCFAAYNMLVLGAFVVLYAIVHVWQQPRGWITIARQAVIVLVVCALIYFILYVITGFNPAATFRAALDEQSKMALNWNRPWPQTIPSDLIEFAFGAGGLAVLLTFFALASRWPDSHRTLVPILWLCVAQPVIVALTGLLRVETSRVWIFMLPLLAVPVGLELSRWPRAHRAMAFACMWIIVAILSQTTPRPCSMPQLQQSSQGPAVAAS